MELGYLWTAQIYSEDEVLPPPRKKPTVKERINFESDDVEERFRFSKKGIEDRLQTLAPCSS